MTTVTPGNLAMGPCTLYVGAFGAVEPADTAVSAAPSSASWVDVGGTLGGLVLSIAEEFAKLEVDQRPMPAESRRTSLDVKIKVKLPEVTLVNLKTALNGGTSSSGSGYSKLSPVMDDSGATPEYKAVMVDGYGPSGKRRRVIIRKVLNTGGGVELEYSKDGQQAFEVEMQGHDVGGAILPYDVIDQV